MRGFIDHVSGIFLMLPQPVRRHVIVGGGALRSYFDGTVIRDYDLFFRSYADYDATVEALARAGWEFKADAPNGTEIAVDAQGRQWNLVGFVFGTPHEHMDRFDFRCCAMVAWWDGIPLFDFAECAVLDARQRRLYVRNNNGTERTLNRVAKYIAVYGYMLDGVNEVEPEPAEPEPEPEEYPDTLAPIGTFNQINTLARQLRRCPRPAGGGGSDGPA